MFSFILGILKHWVIKVVLGLVLAWLAFETVKKLGRDEYKVKQRERAVEFREKVDKERKVKERTKKARLDSLHKACADFYRTKSKKDKKKCQKALLEAGRK